MQGSEQTSIDIEYTECKTTNHGKDGSVLPNNKCQTNAEQTHLKSNLTHSMNANTKESAQENLKTFKTNLDTACHTNPKGKNVLGSEKVTNDKNIEEREKVGGEKLGGVQKERIIPISHSRAPTAGPGQTQVGWIGA